MNNMDNRFMEHFAKRPAKERLNVYTQNLGQLRGEEDVDVDDLIEMCEDQIRTIKAEIKRTTKQGS